MTTEPEATPDSEFGPDPSSQEEIARRWKIGLRRWGFGIALVGALALHPFWAGACLTSFWTGIYGVMIGLGITLVVRAGALSRFLAPREITREQIYSFGLALVLALTIRTFVVQAFKIPSGSMLPTLQVGDHLLVSKFLYGVRVPFTNVVLRIPRVRDPERGDIIVFRYPDNECVDYIKRIVGLPGETIEIRSRRVLIDGELIDDPWGRCDEQIPGTGTEGHDYRPESDFGLVSDRSSQCMSRGLADNHRPFKIPEDHYFMMGDNRQNSKDSRFWSTAKTVHRDKIIGKAWRTYWSWTWKDGLRLDRLGDRVD